MTEDEKKAYDFIKEIFNVFGECEFIAKGNLGVVVKTPDYIHKKYIEINPYVKPKQVKEVKEEKKKNEKNVRFKKQTSKR